MLHHSFASIYLWHHMYFPNRHSPNEAVPNACSPIIHVPQPMHRVIFKEGSSNYKSVITNFLLFEQANMLNWTFLGRKTLKNYGLGTKWIRGPN